MKGRLKKFLKRRGLPKILGLLFTFILCIKLLSACNNQPVTLSFVVPHDQAEAWQPLSEQFQKNNPNIQIKIYPVNSNDTNKLKETYISSFRGTSPRYDLIYMDIIWLPEFADHEQHEEWLLDLSDDFSQQELEKEFLLSEVDNGIYQKKLYRIPFRTDEGVLYYRKDWLDEVKEEAPKTFDDLIRISREVKLRHPGVDGYLWQGQPFEGMAAMFVEVLQGYGGFWINDKKEVGLNKPEAINAVRFLHETIAPQGISPTTVTSKDEKETRNQFVEGEAVFMRNWPNVWVDANGPNSSVRGKIAIQAMVHEKGTNRSSGACKGGWGFGIANTTPHKPEAVKAIKFLTSAAAQRQFTLTFGSVPSRRQLFLEPKIVARYSHYPELLNVIDKYWVARPRIPEYAQASCILRKHLSEALNGDSTPEAAMSAADQETRQLLVDGKSNCK